QAQRADSGWPVVIPAEVLHPRLQCQPRGLLCVLDTFGLACQSPQLLARPTQQSDTGIVGIAKRLKTLWAPIRKNCLWIPAALNGSILWVDSAFNRKSVVEAAARFPLPARCLPAFSAGPAKWPKQHQGSVASLD